MSGKIPPKNTSDGLIGGEFRAAYDRLLPGDLPPEAVRHPRNAQLIAFEAPIYFFLPDRVASRVNSHLYSRNRLQPDGPTKVELRPRIQLEPANLAAWSKQAPPAPRRQSVRRLTLHPQFHRLRPLWCYLFVLSVFSAHPLWKNLGTPLAVSDPPNVSLPFSRDLGTRESSYPLVDHRRFQLFFTVLPGRGSGIYNRP